MTGSQGDPQGQPPARGVLVPAEAWPVAGCCPPAPCAALGQPTGYSCTQVASQAGCGRRPNPGPGRHAWGAGASSVLGVGPGDTDSSDAILERNNHMVPGRPQTHLSCRTWSTGRASIFSSRGAGPRACSTGAGTWRSGWSEWPPGCHQRLQDSPVSPP